MPVKVVQKDSNAELQSGVCNKSFNKKKLIPVKQHRQATKLVTNWNGTRNTGRDTAEGSSKYRTGKQTQMT